MKKFLLVAIIMIGTSTLFAQQNAIKVNILSPIVRTLNLSFEHAIGETSSLQLGFFYTGFSASEVTYRGFGITPEYRLYLSDTPAIEGFYVAPFLRYQSLSVEETFDGSTSKATLSTFGGGLLVGKQWVFKERVTFDIFIGPSYNTGDLDYEDSSANDIEVNGAFNGFGIRTGVTLGLAF